MNGIQFIVNQMTGNIPEIQPPTRRHALPVFSSVEPKPKPQPKNPTRARNELRLHPSKMVKDMRISIDELIDLRESGATFRELSEIAGLSQTAVKYRLIQCGAHTPRPRISDDELRTVASMRAGGSTWAEIEERIGRQRGPLMRAAKRWGLS